MLAKEAAIIIGAIDAVVVAVIALVAYMLNWESEFAALLIAALQSVIVLIGAIATRGQVYSKETYERDIEAALNREQ